ncbi:proteasome ATPase [Myxococcota bacterium]|nr:proteasome ATPase [Myxococcota bacterium]
MSELDSTGRKGFVRDVMRRISTANPGDEEPEASERGPEVDTSSYRDDVTDLQDTIRLFGSDSAEFRRRLDRLVAEFEALRRRHALTRGQFADAERQNERLVQMLQEAKQQIELLKEEVDKLCAPPNSYGIFQRPNKDGTCEIVVDSRPMRVNVHPSLDPFVLEEGQMVVLNEAFNVVEPAGYVARGEIATIVDFIADNRAIVLGHTDDERVVTLAEPLRREKMKTGDSILYDPRTHYAFEKLPKSSVEEVVLEEIPDITYERIGGLGEQIEILRDSVELPYVHPEVFAEHELSPPKGILLYGPPGCGKTLIAKAVANSLAKSIEARTGRATAAYFLNVKGPELLNKYVGETEHKIREVFKKAREKASEDVPVVIFFDEMDSLFRMRGSGISSDMEATVVAQFLSEIDGVEALNNVIVIGASNRQDLIDPAVLRPGRLDLKVKVQRPDKEAAHEIFAKYLIPTLPFHADMTVKYGDDPEQIADAMIRGCIEHMYATTEENKFLEVTYAKGEREIFYFKDFSSGAMIENIVARAKKRAVKRMIERSERGIRVEDLIDSVNDEFKENEDLPNTTNPDDWARISGRKGERIINVRTLISGISRKERSIENINAGQYL